MNDDMQPDAGPEVVKPAAKPRSKPAPKAEAKVDNIPPCPPEDPMAGDKTPEVVAWWFSHHPEQAAARYAGRKFLRPDQ
jgi:hypothetical protein